MASDDEDSLSGYSDFANPPPVARPKAAVKKLKSVEAVDDIPIPENVLVLGSIWRHPKNAGTLVQSLFARQGAQSTMGLKNAGHRTGYSDARGRHGYSMQCVSDPRLVSRQKARCKFFLRAHCVDEGDPRVVRISEIDYEHSLNCLWVNGAVNRKHGTYVKQLKDGVLGSLKFPNTGPKNAGHTELARRTVLAAGDGVLSVGQAWREVRRSKGLGIDAFFKDLSLLPAAIRSLRETDPEGTYVLGRKPLSYTVTGVQDGQELLYMYICPSNSKRYWAHDFPKYLIMDYAHCYGLFGGGHGSVVVKVPGYNITIRVALFKVFTPETKDYYSIVTELVCNDFPEPNGILLDRTTGPCLPFFHFLSSF